MDFAEAAREIVGATSHRAQVGGLDLGQRAEAEQAAAAALTDAVGKSGPAISAIARSLYWKLNPLGTVPTSFYEDANFERLANLIRSTVGGDEQPKVPVAATPVTNAAEEASSIDALFQHFDAEADDGSIASEDLDGIDTMSATASNVPAAKPSAEEAVPDLANVRPADNALGSIQQILVDLVGDLGHVLAVKPEWRGREAEAVSGAAGNAAERILQLSAAKALPTGPSDDEVAEIVPHDWSIKASRALFDSVESEVIVMWLSGESRETAIQAAAARIRTRIGRIVLIDDGIVRNGFDEPVTFDSPKEWAHEVASDVYRVLLSEDFKTYAVAIGAAAREKAIASLAQSVFEDIAPAVAFRGMSNAPRTIAPLVAPATSARTQRESWKMPWSVARNIVEHLCSKSGDEAAFVASFGGWLGLPAANTEAIKNEIVSEVVAIGRERPDEEEEATVSGPTISFVYENYEGKIAVRSAVPVRMTFASNEWHKDCQWLMEAFDLGHGAMRTFAVKGIIKFL